MRNAKKHNLQTFFLAVIMVVTLLYMLLVKPFYYQFNGGEIFFEPILVQKFSPNTYYELHVYGEHLFISSANGLKKISPEGQHLWDHVYYMEQARMFTNKGYICMADLSGKQALLFDENGFLASIRTEAPILMVTVSSAGAVTLLTQNDSGYQLDVFNRLGQLAVRRDIVVAEDGFPVAYDLSDKGTLLAINHIELKNQTINSNLQFFSFSDRDVKDPNYMVGGARFKDVWIRKLGFLDDHHMVALSDQQALFYNTQDGIQQINTYTFESSIKDYGVTKHHVVLLQEDQIQKEDFLTLLDYKGQEKFKITLDGITKGFSVEEDGFFVITPSRIERYVGGERLWFTQNTRNATHISPIYRQYYLIEYAGGYEIIRMKNL